MRINKILVEALLFLCCLAALSLGIPLNNNIDLCSSSNNVFVYDYLTNADIHLNEDLKASVELKTQVRLNKLNECKFLMTLTETSLTGIDASIENDALSVAAKLNNLKTVFTLNSDEILFEADDVHWSRNIKRAIVNSIAKQQATESTSQTIDDVSANVEQRLSFVERSSEPINSINEQNFETKSMAFEKSNEDGHEQVTQSFVNGYLNEMCSKKNQQDLAKNFRSLVNFVKGENKNSLVKIFQDNYKKCDMAGLTFAHAILFADTNDSFEAALFLIENNVFTKSIGQEYPILTALTQKQNVDKNLLNKFASYLNENTKKPYFNKLALVYSTLVNTYCLKNQCSDEELNQLSSPILNQLNSDCNESTLIKSIANIAPQNEDLLNTLNTCLISKQNSLKSRVVIVDALRKYHVEKLASSLENIIIDQNEDNELRINSFLSIVKFNHATEFFHNLNTEFITNENNTQLLNFVVDYAKEHGLNEILENLVSKNEKLKERATSESQSFLNYRDIYKIKDQDIEIETETTLIYSSGSPIIPRNIKFNIKLHLFEKTYELAQITLRLESLDDMLREFFVEKLKFFNLLKNVMEKPTNVFEIFQIMAQKMKFSDKNPFVSISFKTLDSDIFYSEINDSESLNSLLSFLNNKQEMISYIHNMILMSTQNDVVLSNGFVFSALTDVTASFVNDLSVSNYLISSISASKRFQLTINKYNKISFKKESNLFSRLNLDVSLSKEQDKKAFAFTINLLPLKQIELLNFDAKLYTLKNNQYVTLNDMSSTTTNKKCTDTMFNQAFGFDVCSNNVRPDSQEDNESLVSIALFNLNAPYNFDIKIKNKELIKSIVFEIEYENGVQGHLKTIDTNENISNRVELNFAKSSIESNDKIEKNGLVELKLVPTNQVLFKLAGLFAFKNAQLLDVAFKFENKILYQFDSSLAIKKLTTNVNKFVASEYKLEGLFDDASKHYKMSMHLQPTENSMSSDIIIEKSDATTNNELVQVVNGKLNLIKNTQNQFDLDAQVESDNFGQIKVYGNLLATLFQSDMNLFVDYSMKSFNMPKAVTLKIGHLYDVDRNQANFVAVQASVPLVKLDHGVKFLFQHDKNTDSLKNIELLVNTPYTMDKPYNVYYTNDKNEGQSYQNYEFGVRNFNIDLTQVKSHDNLVEYLIKADNEPVLNSLEFQLKKSNEDNKMHIDMGVRKNKRNVARLNGNAYGNLFGQDDLGTSFKVKLLKSTTSLKSKIVKRGNFKFSLLFETDNFLLVKYFKKVNVDFENKINNNVNDFEWNVSYDRGDEASKRTAKLSGSTDCFTGSCFLYKIVYDTDSEILGRNFRHLKFDYVNKVNGKLHDMTFDIDYKLLNDGDNLRSANLLIKTDCINGDCKVYKLKYDTDDQYLGYNWKHLDVDYTMSNDNNINILKMTVDYKRGSEVSQRHTDFILETDCSTGQCKKYLLKYNTDSEYLGYFVRIWNIEYLIKNVDETNEMIINIDYKLSGESNKYSANLLIKTDCSTKGKCEIYKLVYNTDSPLLGKNFKHMKWDYKGTTVNGLTNVKMDIDYQTGSQDYIRKSSLNINTDCLRGDCLVYQLKYISDSSILGYNFKYLNVNHTRKTKNNINIVRTNVVYKFRDEPNERHYDVVQESDVSNDFYRIYKFTFDTDSELLGKYVRFMNIDYVSKLNGKVNTFLWINDYRLADQVSTRKFSLEITTDCIVGDCLIYKIKQKTDSEIMGYVFRQVNLDYQHKFANDLNHIDVDINYILGFDLKEYNYEIALTTDCFTGSCYTYKLNVTNTNENIYERVGLKEFHYDYDGRVRDGLYVFEQNIYYKLPADTEYQTANLILKHDCLNGRCKKTKIIYKTNSLLLGKNFKYLDADFVNVVENQVDKWDLKIDYDVGTGLGIRTYKISVDTDCLVGDCKKYVLDYNTNSETLGRFMRKLNFQWYWKVEKDTYIGWYDVTYRRPSDENEKKVQLRFESDCQVSKGLCNRYKCIFDTDSELFGINYRHFFMDYIATSANNVNEITWEWNYRRGGELPIQEKRTALLNIKTDCFTGDCKLYQLNYKTDSETLGYFFKYLKVDHWRKVKNNIFEEIYTFDFITSDSSAIKSHELYFRHDCVSLGLCNEYKIRYFTESDKLAYFLRSLNMDYTAKTNDAGMAEMNWTWDYRLKDDKLPRNSSLWIKTDCIGLNGNCFVYQLKWKTDSGPLSKNFKEMDIDFSNTRKDTINEFNLILRTRPGGDIRDHNAKLLFRHDCSLGLCRQYKLKYESDSPILGYNYRYLDCDYLLTLNADTKKGTAKFTVDADYGKGLTHSLWYLESDCAIGECTYYKLNVKSDHEVFSWNFNEYNIDFYTKRNVDGLNEIYYHQDYINRWNPSPRYWTIRIKDDCFIGNCNKYKIDYKTNQYMGDHFANIDYTRNAAQNEINIDIDYSNVKNEKKSANVKVSLDENSNVNSFTYNTGDIDFFGKDFKVSKLEIKKVDLENQVQLLTINVDFNDGKPQNALLTLETDCPKGKCWVYKFNYKTESNILGRNFKLLNIDYNYKAVNDKFNQIDLVMNYRQKNDEVPFNYTVYILTDCLSVKGACKVYKQKFSTDSPNLGFASISQLDLDWDSTYDADSKIDEIKIKLDYKFHRGELKNALYSYKTDCQTGKCHYYKLTYKTNCEYLSRNFKLLDFEYREGLTANNLFKWEYNINYHINSESVQRTYHVEVAHDCIFGPCNTYKLLYNTDSEKLFGYLKYLNYDYGNRVENDVNTFWTNIDYQSWTDNTLRKTSLKVVHDCLSGRCKLYKHEFNSNCKLFSRNFKLFNADYLNSVENGIDQHKLKIEYILPNEFNTNPKTATLDIYTDCVVGACDVYKLTYKTDSEILGRNFRLLKIDLLSKLNGKINYYKSTIDYILGIEPTKPHNIILTMDTDCQEGSCNLFKMLYKTDKFADQISYSLKYFKMDYVASINKDDLLNVVLDTEYQLSSQELVRSSQLLIEHDCITGDCVNMKYKYSSNDDDVLGKVFHYLDLYYKSTIPKNGDINIIDMNVDYKLRVMPERKNFKLHFETDCLYGKCRLYKLKAETNSNKLGLFNLFDFIYVFKLNGLIGEMTLTFDYKLKGKSLKTTKFLITSDCYHGSCKDYKQEWSTTSDILGKNFKLLNIDFHQKLDASTKINHYTYAIKYITSSDSNVKFANLDVRSDCLSGPCYFYDLVWNADSERLFSKNFKHLHVHWSNEVKSNGFHDCDVSITYLRPNSQSNKTAAFHMLTDCFVGGCKDFDMTYKTDSEYLGRNFRVLNMDYHQKFENGVNKWSSSVDYQMPTDQAVKNAKISVEYDCVIGACNLYKLDYKSNSEILGRNFKSLNVLYAQKFENKVESCEFDVKYIRANSNVEKTYRVDYSSDCFEGECNIYKVKQRTNCEIGGYFVRYFNLEFYKSHVVATKLDTYGYNLEYIVAGSDDNVRNAHIRIDSDCVSGPCKTYNIHFDSNTPLFARNFKQLDISYDFDQAKVATMEINYILPSESSLNTASLLIDTDCWLGPCHDYVFEWKTNSSVLGQNFRYLRFDWESKNKDTLNTLKFGIDYKRPSDDTKRNALIEFSSDCYTGQCTTYQLSYNTDSDILGSKIQYLKLDVNRQEAEKLSMNVDYRRPGEKDIKHASMTFNSNCSANKCVIYSIDVEAEGFHITI